MGKVAVVTGAASGIGLALAHRAASYGMKVVLADVEERALQAATTSVTDAGAEAVGVRTDVAELASVEDLARRAEETFGPTWLLVNNAGVAFSGRTWELRHADWEWSLKVNLWGVIHGVETFLPKMVESDEGYVLNTASMAGLVVGPGNAHYSAGKHAVVGLTEALHRELAEAGSSVGVSLLCPGLVRTNIASAHRNAPEWVGVAPQASASGRIPADSAARLAPDVVAAQTMQAIEKRQFWILTHADVYADSLRHRATQAAEGRNPDRYSADPVLAQVT
ncbi:SDR family NAD(P)-dependent oxidoreductase [Qaidamihabitans albus]|uniref:SDR family NAD(P)-dependent oxidoreductase n=1 Tax=Qaidamihabitans albus TaxID=2795733 RepID=UPI0018F127A4|nr:SDR family NAD(P)-dependent oxidoreductase [Qaidamihabitans albus]